MTAFAEGVSGVQKFISFDLVKVFNLGILAFADQ